MFRDSPRNKGAGVLSVTAAIEIAGKLKTYQTSLGFFDQGDRRSVD